MAKQKDGRYRAKITVGTDASGKSIVKYVSGRILDICLMLWHLNNVIRQRMRIEISILTFLRLGRMSPACGCGLKHYQNVP